MDREELVDKMNQASVEMAELRKQLEAFDYAEKFNKANKYLGKYFMGVSDYKESIDCLFVYGVDEKNCDLKTVNIRYWINEDDSDGSFEIESSHLFNPETWEEDRYRYTETTKKEFDKHYAEVLRRIELAKNKIS